MPNKGYPRTRFEIIDQTNVQEIPQNVSSSPIPYPMAVYTSDKGPEEWRAILNLNDFTSQTGPMSFIKHGQAQLTVAEELRAGAVVFCKRMVSKDATLANITVRARLVVVDNVAYVYFYTMSGDNCKTFAEACEYGCDFENVDDYETVMSNTDQYPCDVPLFTVTPMGRGVSGLYIRLNPQYVTSKNSTYLRYAFEVYENQELIESITFTMNPEIVIDGVSQAMNPKLLANSTQVKVSAYEDQLYTFLTNMSRYCYVVNSSVEEGIERYNPTGLANMEFINGYDRRGTKPIGGVVYRAEEGNGLDEVYGAINSLDTRVARLEQKSLDAVGTYEAGPKEDLWLTNMSDAIKDKVVNLSDAAGILLTNGTFGAMGISPVQNTEEYTKMLVETFGGNMKIEDSGTVELTALFDPIIYDVDANKLDFICDCNFPMAAKKAIIDLCDFRGDMVFLMDLGTTATSLGSIKQVMDENMFLTDVMSRYVAIYHNFFKIYDPYSKKQITVTMPYLLALRMIDHISNGVSRPFAGILHNVTFPEIIEGSINFLPVEVPGLDQKQSLVDMSVNYLMYYDGLPVMETMYTNSSDYTQLSYLHNIMAIQEVIKAIRTNCPKTRYTFLDGKDLQTYIDDATAVISKYSSNFRNISITYMADEAYESNNIFYATIVVRFRNFIQEEFFRVIAIS